MITESELRNVLDYDDSHLHRLVGPELAERARHRQFQRRLSAGAVALGLAAMAGAAGYTVLERRPHVIHADVAYASGPTMVLPDGRIDVQLTAGNGPARAWLDSEDRICYGDDSGSVCRHPTRDQDREFSVMSADGDGLLGGLVNRPIRSASFTARDGQELPTQVIGFDRFPNWRVVIAVVPRSPAGTVPGPEHFRYSTS
jgi:hypothetical protein